MSDEHYRRIIEQFCDAMALPDPAALCASQHLTVGEMTVALMHDPETEPGALFVYFDLGPIPAALRGRIHEGMLRANLRPDTDAVGHFGVHPETAHAVWHIRFRGLEGLDGASLAGFVAQQVQGLEGWLERIVAPVQAVAA